MSRKWLRWIEWTGWVLWAVFVNLCDRWLLRPAVQDFALAGVVTVMVIALLWWTSIPRRWRRQWVVFTVFALMIGAGWSQLEAGSWVWRLVLGTVMSLGLVVVARLAARVRWSRLFGTAVVLAAANAWIPISDWSVLTHFWVLGSGRVNLNSSDYPAAPLAVTRRPDGSTALVSVERVNLDPDQVETWTSLADETPGGLERALESLDHLYTLVEFRSDRGRIIETPASPSDLTGVDVRRLTDELFPYNLATWRWDGSRLLQAVAPSLSTDDVVRTVADVARIPVAVTAAEAKVEAEEQQSWRAALGEAGLTVPSAPLRVDGNRLVGTFGGRAVSVSVPSGLSVVDVGSFTAARRHEVLLAGPGELAVVSLDEQPARLVGVYHANLSTPLTDDLFVGPLDDSGRDVIYVNSAPAIILQVNPDGNWQRLYTAPNNVLRFETVVQWPGDKMPEIITNDPGVWGRSDVRYLTSYTWRHGQLVRNWRVYLTNFVNVRSLRFTPDGPVVLAGAEYGTGEWLVLSRQWLPVVSIAGTVLFGTIAAGWIWRLREGRTARA